MTPRILVATVAALLASAAAAQESRPPVGSGQVADPVVAELIAFDSGLEAERGRVPSHPVLTGRLSSGESANFRVHTCANIEYKAVGVCDLGCDDLDLTATDRAGEVLDVDVLPDGVPILHFAPAVCGFTTLSVKMVTCDEDSCAWGVQVYIREPEP